MGTAFVSFFFIVALETLAGLAVLGRFGVRTSRPMLLASSAILGMFLHTFLLFLTQLFSVPISTTSVIGTILAGVVLAHVPPRSLIPLYKHVFARPRWTLSMYDIVALCIGAYLLYISVWATYYWPVTPFDSMAGIDLVAKTAVKEGTLNCSIYRDPILAGHLSNQPFYAPFAMLEQVITRSVGFPFGQVWLAVLSISFYVFMFAFLRERIHPFIANILWIFFIMIPEFYGYSLLMQTDFANAVFYSMGGIFMILAVEQQDRALLWTSTAFLAGAAWSRSESFLLVGIMMLIMLPWIIRTFPHKKAFTWVAVSGVIVLAVFAVWHMLWFRVFLPVRPDSGSELIAFDMSRFLEVTSMLFRKVVFDVGYWGMTFYAFFALIIVDLAFILVVSLLGKRVKGPSIFPIVWTSATFYMLLVVGTVFSSAVVDQTLRRGLFKVLPFLYMFMASTAILQYASKKLRTWELGGRR